MRKSIVFSLLAVVFIVAGPVCGDKVTVDPNTTPSTIAVAPSRSMDDRLNQKISYDGVHKRLHDVVDDLSKTTGVKLRCGKSESDWKVRDVPVLVCSRDLPLGVLLRGLADTTHLLLSRNTVDKVISYRIWRDLKREKELAAFEESRQAALLAAISHDWDSLSLLKDVPESALEERNAQSNANPDEGRLWGAESRAVSKAVAELGLEAKDRVLAGEPILLTYQYAPDFLKPHIKAIFESYWKGVELYTAREGQKPPEPLDEERLNKCYIRIASHERGSYRFDEQELSVEICSSGYGYRKVSTSDYETYVRKNQPDLPARPEIPKPNLQTEMLDKRYVKLSLSEKGGPAFLDTKVKIEAPEDGTKPDYSDLLCAVSKAAGCSVIAEGAAARYLYVVFNNRDKVAGMFGRDITMREALAFTTSLDKMDWYVDEENKLIVGRDREWTERLKALVPEKLLRDLSNKMEKDGIDLDDLEPLVGLTRDQVYEWIFCCPEFPEICTLASTGFTVNGGRLWALYFALSAPERALAKAGRPVSLAGCDRAWICSVLRGEMAVQKEGCLLRGKPLPGDPELTPEMMKIDAFTDPDALPDLSIRVEKQELPKPMEGKRRYYINLDGQGDNTIQAWQVLYGNFPVQKMEPKAEPTKP